MLERAKEKLTQYHETVLNKETEPLYLEYKPPQTPVTFEDVRINGKIDKISSTQPDPALRSSAGSAVRVVDYKTSKKAPSLNQIKGGTKNPKDDLLRQLLFYKLLLENDKSFNYTPAEFILDFVEMPKAIEVELAQQEYNDFKNTIKKAWTHIQTLKFLEDSKEFPFCGKCKYCAN